MPYLYMEIRREGERRRRGREVKNEK